MRSGPRVKGFGRDHGGQGRWGVAVGGGFAIEPGQGCGGAFGGEAPGLEQDAEVAEAPGLGQVGQVGVPSTAVVGFSFDVVRQSIGRKAVGANGQCDPAAASLVWRGRVATDGLEAEALEEQTLWDVTDGGQTGGLAGAPDGCEIDLCGDVLTADVVEWGVGLPVVAVGHEGACGSECGIVEVGGGAAVVDGEDEAGIEQRGGVAGPGVQEEADFGGLALGQGDAQIGQAALQGRRGGIAGEFQQSAFVAVGDVGLDGDVEFAQSAALHAHAVDGQGVEEFVGEDAVGRSRERRGVKGEYVGGHAVGIGERGFVPGGLYWVNDGVADGVGEIVGQVARCGEYVAAEEAVASAGLDNREGVGAFQQGPEVEELDGEQGAEGGMDPGAWCSSRSLRLGGCSSRPGRRGRWP